MAWSFLFLKPACIGKCSSILWLSSRAGLSYSWFTYQLTHQGIARGSQSVLRRSSIRGLVLFVAPKADCQSALRPRARRVGRPGLSRPGVRPTSAFRLGGPVPERSGELVFAADFTGPRQSAATPARHAGRFVASVAFRFHNHWQAKVHTVQSSTFSPAICRRSVSRLTSVAPTASAVAAIHRSFSSKARPFFCRASFTFA
jgi:hypothetical protein